MSRRVTIGVFAFIALAGVVALAIVRPWLAPDPRTPMPAPEVTLSAQDEQVWRPGPADRAAIPVLLYHGLGSPEEFSDAGDAAYGLERADFAKQMELLHHAGYRTVSLPTVVDFVAGRRPDLPAHPLLLTFDDGRADSWLGADDVLRRLGYRAVMFVDAGAVDAGDRAYLTWDELAQMQRSGRWDAQLHAGRGHHNIRYGPGENDVGPYYAYREQDETLDDWERRVQDDVLWGLEQMKEHIPGFRPLAFAPPYGNLGQVSTNDPKIPIEAQAWLSRHFDLAFVQDRSGFAQPDGAFLQGRFQLSRAVTGGELHDWLANPPAR